MKKPSYIGPETIKKASTTLSGLYASAIDRVLYAGDVRTENGFKRFVTAWSVQATGLPGAENHSMETDKLLREIRDHLETMALKEVIP